jgi:hypothetical protein
MSYRSVWIRYGDTLSGLFGDKWHRVYSDDCNRCFRLKFPNPNNICPGHFIHFPESINASKPSVPYKPDNLFSPSPHSCQELLEQVCTIIPYRETDSIRKQHLLGAMDRFPNVVVVDPPGDRFNRGRAFNLGLRKTSKRLVIFADSDIVVSRERLISSCEKALKFDAVTPYTSCFSMSPDQTKAFYRDGSLTAFDRRTGLNIASCALIMQREKALQIGGWEEIEGWGAEDNIQAIKISRSLTHATCEGPIFHLYHPTSARIDSQEVLLRYEEAHQCE